MKPLILVYKDLSPAEFPSELSQWKTSNTIYTWLLELANLSYPTIEWVEKSMSVQNIMDDLLQDKLIRPSLCPCAILVILGSKKIPNFENACC